MKKKLLRVSSLFLVLCILFTGCGAAEEESSTARVESQGTVSEQEKKNRHRRRRKEAQTCPHTPTQLRKYG